MYRQELIYLLVKCYKHLFRSVLDNKDTNHNDVVVFVTMLVGPLLTSILLLPDRIYIYFREHALETLPLSSLRLFEA